MLQSAFISVLADTGLGFFSLFAVDLMHEFKLGVWKAVLTHLIRIIHTKGSVMVTEFDGR